MPLIVCGACGTHNLGHGRTCAFCSAPLGPRASPAAVMLGLALATSAMAGCIGGSQLMYGVAITKVTADTAETGDTGGSPTTPAETADTGA
ncbi:MAG: hypothetical protein ABMA64_39625 [Myxococcota bacterium]